MPCSQEEPHVYRGLGRVPEEETGKEGGSLPQQHPDWWEASQSMVRRDLEHKISAKVQMGSPERAIGLREGRPTTATAHGSLPSETRGEFLHAEGRAESDPSEVREEVESKRRGV